MKKHELTSVNSIHEGQMKIFEVGGHRILLAKKQEKLYAVSGTCPHYGAPLEQGVLYQDRLMCPWHHACFNIKSGQLLEPPALDNLYKYELSIENEKVYVDLPTQDVASATPHIHQKDAIDNRKFVIIGGGASGFAAAQALREEGFTGTIQMITLEQDKPYDRPGLSKSYMQDPSSRDYLPLRPSSFYSEYQIDIKYDNEVTDLDVQNKSITLNQTDQVSYDKLLIATGGIPRQLEVEGKRLENIFTLRSFENAQKIIDAARQATHIAIIGSSFIGMEVAFSLLQHNKKKVTIISPDAVPFEKTLGREVGEVFKKKHEEQGTNFILNQKVKKFEGDRAVKSVILENLDQVKSDLVVVGIGVRPGTDFVKGLTKMPDQSLRVDAYLACTEDIYASGDIATYPDWRSGELIRIEHWRVALQQGRIAGQNMAGNKEKYTSTPFFWTRQAGLSLGYVGYASQWDELVIEGDLSQTDFLAYYISQNKLMAVAGMQRSKELDAINLLMSDDQLPDLEKIRN
ncbi:MAG: FAD-dependent oxidoreductase, partial [Candidatus Cyclobacteriaceae bacterium M3_2C_046]